MAEKSFKNDVWTDLNCGSQVNEAAAQLLYQSLKLVCIVFTSNREAVGSYPTSTA